MELRWIERKNKDFDMYGELTGPPIVKVLQYRETLITPEGYKTTDWIDVPNIGLIH